MSLFSGDITQAQKDVEADILAAQTAANQSIALAIGEFKSMLSSLIEGYTIEIKAVKK